MKQEGTRIVSSASGDDDFKTEEKSETITEEYDGQDGLSKKKKEKESDIEWFKDNKEYYGLTD